MQIFCYFCGMKKRRLPFLLLLLLTLSTAWGGETRFALEDIILDIYHAATELGEVDYEQLQSDLYALHEAPIDFNAATEEELEQLVFLSPGQIDDILAYVGRHPMDSLYELRLIPSLTDYEIRDLLPFVTLEPPSGQTNERKRLYAKEVFVRAAHELIARADVRNIEGYEGSDPVYTQFRYRFDYRRRVTFGLQLRRPAGGMARDLQYGAYLQLRDIGPLHTLVGGNFQASFGQGLVLAPVFRLGKSAYVSHAGQQQHGLRYYSSVDGNGLHGAGATFRHVFSPHTRLDITALYSLRRENDSVRHHIAGANLTLRHRRLQVELTAVENIWSDSIHPYQNTAYNRYYFRGRRQAVLGASARYNHGWFDVFGEVATAQNRDRWGFGTIVGSRFYPADGVSLVALYRYYSPHFDNQLGYAFSETSRIGNEQGGYLGFEVTRLRRWRFSGYADFFYFPGPKYGIPAFPSWGYDALAEIEYRSALPSPVSGDSWSVRLRLRAREKGSRATYSGRLQFDCQTGGWSLRTTGEANWVQSYGVTVYQDVAYDFSPAYRVPLSLRVRAQWFDAREWDNRIYCFEHDVLYAFSVPAVYGAGARAYLCLRWQIVSQLALYMRLSETVYLPGWASAHNRANTRTDIHLQLRATL